MVLSAGEPIERLRCTVGRSSTVLVDPARDDRVLGVDCWYPALDGDGPRSVYELLPGVGFNASALADPEPAPGPHPLLVFSHGRSGTRSSYAMLCEMGYFGTQRRDVSSTVCTTQNINKIYE